MSEPDGWVAVGMVLRPHGLKGAVIVRPLTRTADEFLDMPVEHVTLRDRRGKIGRRLHVEGIQVHKQQPMIYFREIADRNAAEEIAGMDLVIPESERWELPEGQFYIDDLIGLDVFEGDRRLGRVLSLMEGANHDFLVFTHPEDEKREVILPYIPEMVPKIDLAAKRVDVVLPEGLLEI